MSFAKISTVVFQGFSRAGHVLSLGIRRRLGGRIRLFVVYHVSPAQFEHHFEIDMLGLGIALRRDGVLDGLGSVKPGYGALADELSDITLINSVPQIRATGGFRDVALAFVPLENTWRKNLYTNLLACQQSTLIEHVIGVNEPSFAGALDLLPKFKRVGFLDRYSLYSLMTTVGIVMNVTLVECQPMTQLEAFAVGTPCLCGPLRLPLPIDEASRLFEVSQPDDFACIKNRVDTILTMWRRDRVELDALIAHHVQLRNEWSDASYLAFLNS